MSYVHYWTCDRCGKASKTAPTRLVPDILRQDAYTPGAMLNASDDYAKRYEEQSTDLCGECHAQFLSDYRHFRNTGCPA